MRFEIDNCGDQACILIACQPTQVHSTDFVLETLRNIVTDVQSGKRGTPDSDTLQLCGEIHCILEKYL
jgi:hypothetical protein